MEWLHHALVTLFNAAIWEAAINGRLSLADLPALGKWMKHGWPAIDAVPLESWDEA